MARVEVQTMINREIWEKMISSDVFSGDVLFSESMKRHTSLRIGGPADVIASPKEILSLKNLIVLLKRNNIPFIIAGGGTNLLVRDNGIEDVVVSLTNFRRMEIVKKDDDDISIFAESGLPLQKLVSFARENGFSGIEGLVGIPGSLGGAIAGNAGSFGCEIKDIISSATLMYSDGGLETVTTESLDFGYRSSGIKKGTLILSAMIRLKRGVKEDVEEKMENFLKEKRGSQPLSEWSAGCVFKNHEGTSAGKLIDEAGCRGMRIGDIEVSDLHANFFINKGNATASDFLRLMDDVRKKVMDVFGIELKPEIRIVGRG